MGIDRVIQNRKPAIAFYGGEPLLRFDLIKNIIELVKNYGKFEKFAYNFTTNGTLLSDHVIKYMVKNNIGVLISLDEPKQIHNRYRV